MVDIVHIQLHPLIKRNIIPSTDLPNTGDARPHAEPPAVPVFVETFIVSHLFTDCVHPANQLSSGTRTICQLTPNHTRYPLTCLAVPKIRH